MPVQGWPNGRFTDSRIAPDDGIERFGISLDESSHCFADTHPGETAHFQQPLAQ